jgi:hypothetical protein
LLNSHIKNAVSGNSLILQYVPKEKNSLVIQLDVLLKSYISEMKDIKANQHQFVMSKDVKNVLMILIVRNVQLASKSIATMKMLSAMKLPMLSVMSIRWTKMMLIGKSSHWSNHAHIKAKKNATHG